MSKWKTVYLAVLIASWIVLLALMWKAFTTMPSAQELADAKHVPPPLPRDAIRLAVTSLVELLVVIAMLWPRRTLYATRALTAAVLIAMWFFATTPLSLNRMQLVHRQWLVLIVLGSIAAAIAQGGPYLLQRARRLF